MTDIETPGLGATLRHSRPVVLLAALVLNLVLGPLMIRPGVQLAVNSAIILAAASLAADTAVHRRVTALLAVPGLVLLVTAEILDKHALSWVAFVFVVALYLHVIRLMLHRIFLARMVTLDEIGLGLCVYVLLGAVWALFYIPVVQLDPTAFAFAHAPVPGRESRALLYFSYVTLTTLGYGDTTPVSPLAQGLAAVEALTGVLYLAVLVSRLVGTYKSRRD